VTDYPDDDAPTIECMHGRSRPGGELMIWVRFHPDRLPNSWWEFTDDDDSPAAPQPVGAGSTIHALRRTFGPGVFGLRWTFA
jgi:hypothetical protein